MKRHEKKSRSNKKGSASKTKILLIMIVGLLFLSTVRFAIAKNDSSSQQAQDALIKNNNTIVIYNNSSPQSTTITTATTTPVPTTPPVSATVTIANTGLCAGKQGTNCQNQQPASDSANKNNKNGFQNALQFILDEIKKLIPFMGQPPKFPTQIATISPTMNPNPMDFYYGKIVHYPADGSIWLLAQNKARYPIPDTATYNCLVTQGYSDAGNLSSDELIKYSQQSVIATCGGNVLRRGHVMFKNTYLKSNNGQYTLWLQSDRNIVIYQSGSSVATWATFVPADMLIQQDDGNLASYTWGETLGSWNTGTWGIDINNYTTIQDDGNLVVYSTNKAVWSSLYHHVNK